MKVTLKDKLSTYKQHPFSLFLMIVMVLAMVFTVGITLSLIVYIVYKGVPNLSPELFELKFTAENQSMLPSIINTVIMTVITLVIAVPLGIGAAVYLTEYAKRGNKLVKVARITAETLSGIPSIVFGLFGFLMFNIALHWGYSLISGAITLAMMVLPTIMRTSEEALLAVPDSYREGSFGLGAGKVRTIFSIIIPSAMPGILSGIILSIGRIVGETAALIFTAGTYGQIPENLFSSARTLSVHVYALLNEGLYMDKAYATAFVLLVLVVLINLLSKYVGNKLTKK
ncbi:MAG: phosphate ABC transporter permease PstA [Oscillospiraceae bacterium]|nr:phosphate ABC transporter permease PstA [Oscillospiraceae bacterium]